MATLSKILTLDNLHKRRIIVVEWYCTCKKSGKSVNHLPHCEVAQALWRVIFTLFDVTWVMLGRVLDLLACWRGQRGNHSVMDVMENSPIVLNVDYLERAECTMF